MTYKPSAPNHWPKYNLQLVTEKQRRSSTIAMAIDMVDSKTQVLGSASKCRIGGYPTWRIPGCCLVTGSQNNLFPYSMASWYLWCIHIYIRITSYNLYVFFYVYLFMYICISTFRHTYTILLYIIWIYLYLFEWTIRTSHTNVTPYTKNNEPHVFFWDTKPPVGEAGKKAWEKGSMRSSPVMAHLCVWRTEGLLLVVVVVVAAGGGGGGGVVVGGGVVNFLVSFCFRLWCEIP